MIRNSEYSYLLNKSQKVIHVLNWTRYLSDPPITITIFMVVMLVMNKELVKDLCLSHRSRLLLRRTFMASASILNISIFVVLAFLVFLRYDEYRNGVLLRQLRAYLRDGPGQSRDVA